MVPNGWKQVDLGSLFDFKNGLNNDKEHYGSGYKFVNVMDVFGNDILTEDKIIGRVQVSDNQIVGYQLQYGDVLFNRTSETFDEIAMAAVYLDDAVATFGGFVIRGRPKSNDIYPEYSAFLFQAESYRTQAIKLGQGAVRANIGQKDLAKVNVLLPSIEEQNKIVHILSTWDQAISTTEKLLENSQQQKKALMQQLLTGKKRLLDEDGVRFSESWCLVKLRDVVKIDRGFAFKSDQYKEQGMRIIRVTNLESNGYIETVDCVYLDQGEVLEYQKYALREHDVLLVMVGATAGKLGFVTEQTLPALLNQNMWLLRSKDMNQFTQSFLKYLSQVFIEKYLSAQQGSARGFFTQSTFEKVTFKIPKVEEQLKIVGALDLADQEIDTLQKKLDCLKQEKKALMQQLLTGKKRVKVAV
ncbi:restriction endonuclease subunit S [Acinetobacter oleivorans]|uniref:restriction endonuclease subunit S n=1 Tax=Acinetobacter oleivorans TaxID=1148157 RepID=UPI00301750D7